MLSFKNLVEMRGRRGPLEGIRGSKRRGCMGKSRSLFPFPFPLFPFPFPYFGKKSIALGQSLYGCPAPLRKEQSYDPTVTLLQIGQYQLIHCVHTLRVGKGQIKVRSKSQVISETPRSPTSSRSRGSEQPTVIYIEHSSTAPKTVSIIL